MMSISITFILILLGCVNVNAQLNQFGILSAKAMKLQVLYGNNPEAGHYIQYYDTKLYYEECGSGQSIVLIHGGIMGSIDEMAGFIEKIQSGYQVIAISTRGH